MRPRGWREDFVKFDGRMCEVSGQIGEVFCEDV